MFYYQWWQFETYYVVDNPLFNPEVDPFIKQELATAFELMQQDIEEENEDEEVIDDLFSFTAESAELVLSGKTRKLIKALFEEFNLEIDEIKHKRKVYYTAIVSGEKVFENFKSQDQNGFTIKFKTGDYDEVRGIWHGMVDQLREPARYANKALTEILYVIASNSKGGVMYEKDAVANSKRFEEQWATTDAAIRVEPGALSGGKIQPKAQSALPSGYENVLEAAKSGMFEVSGINPEFLGSSENKQVSALLEAQRIEQVTSTLATYFDSITLYQKEQGKTELVYMRILFENNPEITFRVLGTDGTQAYSAVKQAAVFSEYDISVQEIPITATKKSEDLTILMTFAQNMLLGGINVYEAVIDELPINQTKKDKIRKLISPEPTPEQQAAQQQKQQLEAQVQSLALEEKQTDIDKKKAEIIKLDADTLTSEVGIPKTKAETLKTLQEAEQTELENDQLAVATRSQVSFII